MQGNKMFNDELRVTPSGGGHKDEKLTMENEKEQPTMQGANRKNLGSMEPSKESELCRKN